MFKVLVIEDEKQIREELVDWLTFEGYDPFEAADGQVGLDLALSENLDLIICDIRMPLMDGYEVLRAVQAEPDLKQIPFVFATASAELASVQKGIDLGATAYITKPFTFDEVMAVVQACLGQT